MEGAEAGRNRSPSGSGTDSPLVPPAPPALSYNDDLLNVPQKELCNVNGSPRPLGGAKKATKGVMGSLVAASLDKLRPVNWRPASTMQHDLYEALYSLGLSTRELDREEINMIVGKRLAEHVEAAGNKASQRPDQEKFH